MVRCCVDAGNPSPSPLNRPAVAPSLCLSPNSPSHHLVRPARPGPDPRARAGGAQEARTDLARGTAPSHRARRPGRAGRPIILGVPRADGPGFCRVASRPGRVHDRLLATTAVRRTHRTAQARAAPERARSAVQRARRQSSNRPDGGPRRKSVSVAASSRSEKPRLQTAAQRAAQRAAQSCSASKVEEVRSSSRSSEQRARDLAAVIVEINGLGSRKGGRSEQRAHL